MAATRGRKFWGSIFFNDLYVLKNTCAKCHAFLTKCTILVLSRPTTRKEGDGNESRSTLKEKE